MDKWQMQKYIEENFYAIIEDHLLGLSKFMIDCHGDVDILCEALDMFQFYKAWKESGNYEISVFLKEVDEDK